MRANFNCEKKSFFTQSTQLKLYQVRMITGTVRMIPGTVSMIPGTVRMITGTVSMIPSTVSMISSTVRIIPHCRSISPPGAWIGCASSDVACWWLQTRNNHI